MITTVIGPNFERLSERAIGFLYGASPLKSGEGKAPPAGFAVSSCFIHQTDPVVVYPSIGIKDAFTRALAQKVGIAAGIEWTTFSGLLAAVTSGDPADDLLGERAVWVLYDLLHKAQKDCAAGQSEAFGSKRLARFLAGKNDKALFRFASSLKELFTRYATYRPDWLTSWLAGGDFEGRDRALCGLPDYGWQKAVLLALRKRGFSGLDALGGIEAALERIASERCWAGRRIAVLMPGVLPPLAEKLFEAISGAGGNVGIFVEAPADFSAGIDSEARLEGMADFRKHVWRATARMLERLAAVSDAFESDYASPEASKSGCAEKTSNLGRVQSAILGLSVEAPDRQSARNYDESIVVLQATSLRRELETFADRLEVLFRAHPTLGLHDAMLLFPDLEASAAAVHAVFGTRRVSAGHAGAAGTEAARAVLRMPYVVSGKRPEDENAFAAALIGLLRLPLGTCSDEALFSWLSLPVVLQALGLSRDSLELLRAWFAKAGFRYGISGRHLQALARSAGRTERLSDKAHAFSDEDATLTRAMARLAAGFFMPDSASSEAGYGIRPVVAPDTLPTVGTEWGGRDNEGSPQNAGLLRKIAGIASLLETLVEAYYRPNGEPESRLLRAMASPGSEEMAADAGDWTTLFAAVAQALATAAGPSALRAEAERFRLLLTQVANDLQGADEAALSASTASTALCGIRRMRTGDAASVAVPAAIVCDVLEARSVARAGTSKPQDVLTVGMFRALADVPTPLSAIFGLSAACGMPRRVTAAEHDLLAASEALCEKTGQKPRPGDVNPVDEDWRLFGAAILAAQDWLHLSYALTPDVQGRLADDPSPLLLDFERFVAQTLGALENTGAFPIVRESPADFDPKAFASGLCKDGERLRRADSSPETPLRTWRSVDSALCEALERQKPSGEAALKPSDDQRALRLRFASLGVTGEGDIDFGCVIQWLRKPADIIGRVLGISSSNADSSDGDGFTFEGTAGYFEKKGLFEELAQIRRVSDEGSRHALLTSRKATLCADPVFGAKFLRKDKAENVMDRFESGLTLWAQHEEAHKKAGDLKATLRIRIPVFEKTRIAGQCAVLTVPDVFISNEGLSLNVLALGKVDAFPNAGSDYWWQLAFLNAGVFEGSIEVLSVTDADLQTARDKLDALRAEASPASESVAVMNAVAELNAEGREIEEKEFQLKIAKKKETPDNVEAARPHHLIAAASALFEKAKEKPGVFLWSKYDPTLLHRLQTLLLPSLDRSACEDLARESEALSEAFFKALKAKQNIPKVRLTACSLAEDFIARHLAGGRDAASSDATAAIEKRKEPKA